MAHLGDFYGGESAYCVLSEGRNAAVDNNSTGLKRPIC